jgi:predicted neutral ceramidase superfamily lipid hydrolase
MTDLQTYSFLIIVFNILIWSTVFVRLPSLRYYAWVALTWLFNSAAFYLCIEFYRQRFTSHQLNHWSTILRLQAGILLLAVGVSIITRFNHKKI